MFELWDATCLVQARSQNRQLGVCFFVRDRMDEKQPLMKHALFERLTKNPIFEIVAYSKRVDELEAKYVHTRFNKKIMILRGSCDNKIK